MNLTMNKKWAGVGRCGQLGNEIKKHMGRYGQVWAGNSTCNHKKTET